MQRPYLPENGTWSGDVLLNSLTNYFLGDWASGNEIDIPSDNEFGPAVELYSVLLHEAGNALGLADNNRAGAVMNGTYSGPNGVLKSTDISAIRSIYGPRTDVYEPTSNNTRSRATPIVNPNGYNGAQPLSINGSLNSRTDQDFYRVTPLANREKLTVRLWAAGISLVKAQIEVLDRFGNKLADAKADSIFENNLQLEIGSLQDHPTLFIRVVPNTDDVFGIGDYRLEVDYRPMQQQPSIVPPIYDADAEDDDDDNPVEFVSVDRLFSEIGLLDSEVAVNDTLQTAKPLLATVGYTSRTNYEMLSSLSGATDRDLWSFQAPSFQSPVLEVNIDPVGLQNPRIEAYILNQAGDRIAASGVRKPDGGTLLTVNNPVPNETYILFIRSRAGSQFSSGNYVVVTEFTTNASNATSLYSSTVNRDDEHFYDFEVLKTQLFRFDLNAMAASQDSGVQMSIYNAITGDVVTSFSTRSGVLRSEYVWLAAGSYIFRATARYRTATNFETVSFNLRVAVVSDDQGPSATDPTYPSNYATLPNYRPTRRPRPRTPPPVVNTTIPPAQNPWNSTYNHNQTANYYGNRLQ
jgi:hypothetical protein